MIQIDIKLIEEWAEKLGFTFEEFTEIPDDNGYSLLEHYLHNSITAIGKMTKE